MEAPAPSPVTRTAAWLLATAVAAAAPLLAILAAGRTAVWRDTDRLFAPIRSLVVPALREGRLPAWNPYEGLGVPLFAQAMHSVLHPVSVAQALLVPDAGMDAILVAHVALAAAGAFVLSRALGASAPASAVSGLAYGLSGYVLSMTSVVQYLAAAGAAPWTVAALVAAGCGARWGLVAASIAVAVQAFAGDPQWLLVTVLLGASLGWADGGARGAARVVVGVAVGALLGAVQLAPSWAYFRETTRALLLDEIDRVQWALVPARMPELFLPGLFFGRPGEGAAPVFAWLGGPSIHRMPFVPGIVVGGAVLWLAVAGVRQSRATRAVGAAALVFVWLSLGTLLGATQALQGVPVWGAFRYAEKMVGPLTLCVAILAGAGADRIRPTRRAALAAGAIAAGAALLAALAAAGPGTESALRSLGAPDDVAGEAAHRIAVGLLHAAGALALLAAALGLTTGARMPAFPALAAVAVAAAGLVASPLSLYAGKAVPRDDGLLGPVRAADPMARLSVPFPLLRGPADLDHWARVHWMESRLGMPSHGVEARVGNIDAYSGVLPTRVLLVSGAFAEHFGPARLQAFRRLGLSHVVVGEPATAEQATLGRAALEGARLMLRDPTWGASVWSVPHRDWASFAPATVAATSLVDAARTLVELMASSRPDVVVEGAPPSTLSTGQVLSASRTEDEVRIVARSDGAGLLVVNEAFAPGWKAAVDGVPVEVLATDVAVRSVPWPAGRHELRMWYEMPGWTLGAWLAGLGAVALAALALTASRARPAGATFPRRPGAARRRAPETT